MKRTYRLAKRTDFERVRREGTSYAHPLIVLVTHPNELNLSRIGVAAGRSAGGAVERNRARRRIRETVRPLIPYIHTGWDLLFIARPPIHQADFQQLRAAVQTVLRRAYLINGN